MGCRFQAFTVTSDPKHAGAQRLQRSANYWGWDLKTLVHLEGWDRRTYRAQQIAQLRALQEYDPDFFLYLDAWDTIFTGPPQELQVNRGELVFCGDTLLGEWQDKKLGARMVQHAYPQVELNSFRFVNDGVFWGDSAVFRELAGDYLQNYPECINQDYFNQRYAMENSLKRTRLKVDTRATTCINIMGLLAKNVERRPNNRMVYKPFETSPIVLHSPGTGLTEPIAPMPKWMEELYCAE